MTKNTALGAIGALIIGTTAAWAADLPARYTKAPAPVAVYDWTGLYIGAAAGGSIGTSTHIDQATGLGDTRAYNVMGGLLGGTLGYNWQMAHVVFGLEGDASWVGEYGSHIDDGLAGNPNFTSLTSENWLATVRGRIGYDVNNLMFYGTGGYAAAGINAGVKSSVTNVLLDSSTIIRNGWTLGGGLEWGFAPNWSAKFEYLYMKFEDKPMITVNLGPGFNRSAVTLDDNIFRAGINYRFGGPAVAKN